MINLTQHQSTPEQGCHDLTGSKLALLKEHLTFDSIPDRGAIRAAAAAIADLAKEVSDKTGETRCMIGGAPFLMSELEIALKDAWLKPFYAFSKRESVDLVQQDGSVKKVAVFKHVGFIPA